MLLSCGAHTVLCSWTVQGTVESCKSPVTYLLWGSCIMSEIFPSTPATSLGFKTPPWAEMLTCAQKLVGVVVNVMCPARQERWSGLTSSLSAGWTLEYVCCNYTLQPAPLKCGGISNTDGCVLYRRRVGYSDIQYKYFVSKLSVLRFSHPRFLLFLFLYHAFNSYVLIVNELSLLLHYWVIYYSWGHLSLSFSCSYFATQLMGMVPFHFFIVFSVALPGPQACSLCLTPRVAWLGTFRCSSNKAFFIKVLLKFRTAEIWS